MSSQKVRPFTTFGSILAILIIFLDNDREKKVVRKLASLFLILLVSGLCAKIVDSGLLLKVCLIFVSDEGRGGRGVRGEGGAERRAPPAQSVQKHYVLGERLEGIAQERMLD